MSRCYWSSYILGHVPLIIYIFTFHIKKMKEGYAMLDTSYQSNGGEELEHVNSAQSTVRIIHERKLQEVTNLREQLQQMEIELAREIGRSEMMELQNNFEDKLKEHTDSNNNLKEQFHEREQHIPNHKRKVEQKDREL